ncbi:hypothetical protein DH2020_005534 [Rehmannia glutinosa]|uniref:Polygalacturonase n=1 Tax=Rehmannia glutinosa TaxID=99300 RepID=A0ABR0XG71_REHGL
MHHWDFFDYCAISCRAHSASLTEFGGVGDGTTSNTRAFQAAVDHLSQFESDGGSMLFVPPGKWLTGSFNITNHFTLFLHKDAVLLASQDESEYAVIEPLPSYGRGRDTEGGRYISLIFGINLTDVVITGNNGTIDGQGEPWWDKFHKGELQYTRPYLIEIMHSENIQISNLTLLNSPSWHVHPVYCSNVIVQGLTILAPVTVPNTDGINPGKFMHKHSNRGLLHRLRRRLYRREERLGRKYGIAFGMPTAKQLVIRRLTCISPFSAVIALRKRDVRRNPGRSSGRHPSHQFRIRVRIKTAAGRGGYVKDIYVRGMTMKTMKWAFWMTGNYGSHADNNYDPNALPVIQNINYRDMVAENVTMAARDLEWCGSSALSRASDQGSEYVAACNFPTDSLRSIVWKSRHALTEGHIR